jgi:YbgC/YbaW family acyl-CoA thioester hydrolase
MKTYRCSLVVRGYELDSFGHVNHANYLNYLEHARWTMLAEEGITLALMERENRWPVIAKIEVTYLKPTFMGETLEVLTRCTEFSRVSMIFEQTIQRDGEDILKARVHGVTVNEEGRPAKHLAEMERLRGASQ